MYHGTVSKVSMVANGDSVMGTHRVSNSTSFELSLPLRMPEDRKRWSRSMSRTSEGMSDITVIHVVGQ